jgi:small neutral amino acid transporter SnatA (MarC family)
MSQTTSSFITAVAGLLAILGAIFNWRLTVSESKLLSRLFGVRATRIVTAVVGFLLFGLGTGIILGWF